MNPVESTTVGISTRSERSMRCRYFSSERPNALVSGRTRTDTRAISRPPGPAMPDSPLAVEFGDGHDAAAPAGRSFERLRLRAFASGALVVPGREKFHSGHSGVPVDVPAAMLRSALLAGEVRRRVGKPLDQPQDVARRDRGLVGEQLAEVDAER